MRTATADRAPADNPSDNPSEEPTDRPAPDPSHDPAAVQEPVDEGNPPWLSTALITEGAVLTGLAIGALAGLGLSLPLVLGVLLAPVVLLATVVSAEIGLLMLVILVYTNASDVLIGSGLPNTLQPLLALLVLTIVLRSTWQHQLPRGLLLPAAFVAAYGAVLSLSLFFAVDFEGAYLAVSSYAKDALIALVVLTLLRTAGSLERVLWALVTVGFLLAAVGVFQYLTGSFGQEFGGFAQADVKNIAGNTDDYRISGPIADPNHYAQILLVLSAVALGRLRASGPLLARAFAGTSLLLILLAVVFTFSRGALLALGVLVVVAMVRRPPPLSTVLAALAVVLVLQPLLPTGYTDRLASLGSALPGIGDGRSGETSLSGRLSALRAGQGMALDNPVLGVGAGQFTQHFREYSLGLGLDTPNGGLEPHNLLLQVAAETGQLGLLTFGGLLGLAAWRLRRGRRDLQDAGHERHAVMLGDLQLALLGYLLAGIFVHLAYPRFLYALLGICFAVPFVVRDLVGRMPDTVSSPSAPVSAVQEIPAVGT